MNRTKEFQDQCEKLSPSKELFIGKPRSSSLIEINQTTKQFHEFQVYIKQLVAEYYTRDSLIVKFNDKQLQEFLLNIKDKEATLSNKIIKIQNKEIKEILLTNFDELIQTFKNLIQNHQGIISNTKSSKSLKILDESDSEQEQELTNEQKQIFMVQNKFLQEQFNSQIIETTQKIDQISLIQSQIALHLNQQSETITAISNNLDIVSNNVSNGNEYLIKAKENFGPNKTWVFYFFFGASLVLLLLDYFYK